MSTVLVTGGSGFIGSHSILQLLAAGHQVRTTVRNLSRKGDVRAMLQEGGAEPGDRLSFIAADLEADAGWSEAVAGCQYVLHVASPMTPRPVQGSFTSRFHVPSSEVTCRGGCVSNLSTVARHERAHWSVLSARSRSADVALTGSTAATVVVPTVGPEQALCAREIRPETRFLPLTRPQPGLGGSLSALVSVSLFAYADVMYATAVVEGKVVRFKLSPALARAHRQNRGKTMTEGEAVAFVEAKRRARALRRARPYLASRS